MKKKKVNKKKINISYLLIVCGIFVLIGLIYYYNSNKNIKPIPYKNIKYREITEEGNDIHTEYACITFLNDKEYSMYDCDSEPTNYFFDSEDECKFKYDGKQIKFKCKYNYSDVKDKKIYIITWDKDTFKFKYDGHVKIFKSEEWINNNLVVE